MTKTVTAVPLGSDALAPDFRLNLRETEFVRLAPSTIEKTIGQLKAEQAEYLRQLEHKFNPVPPAMTRPRPVLTRRPARPRVQPPLTRAVRSLDALLADVHPAVAADVVRRSGGDVRRVVVHSPTRVTVLNQPCGD